MELPAINPNIIVMTIVLGMGIFGLLVGKTRLRLIILSTYVGIVLAEQLGQVVAPYVRFISLSQVSWLLLGLPILIFGLARSKHGGRSSEHKGAIIANLIVGLATGALVVSSGLRLLPTSELAAIDQESFFAMELQQSHLWLLGLLPLVALIFGFMKGKEKK